MRHRKTGRKIGTDAAHRRAILDNLARDLFIHERIQTTEAKAKELRRTAEKLITLAKEDTLAHRRQAFNTLRDKAVVHKLFTEIAPKMKDRPGGYTRIIKVDTRSGDNAPMVLIELVE